MFGLTTLGIIHTAISLVAVGAGIAAFIKYKEIPPGTRLGKLYIHTTILTCLTGFGIFQHGGFGKPHALGIITLLVLGVVMLAARTRYLGRFSPYVVTVGCSLTFFFHMIPGVTETTTRLPAGAPLVADRDGPVLQAVAGGLFVLFLLGATLQVRRMRAKPDGTVDATRRARRGEVFARIAKPEPRAGSSAPAGEP